MLLVSALLQHQERAICPEVCGNHRVNVRPFTEIEMFLSVNNLNTRIQGLWVRPVILIIISAQKLEVKMVRISSLFSLSWGFCFCFCTNSNSRHR